MPAFPEFATTVRAKYPHVFKAGSELPALSKAIFDKPVDGNMNKIVRALSKIIANDFGALLLLAENGYGIEAAKIARTMFEASVNIAYLRQHPEELDNFIDYHDLTNHKLYEHLKVFAPAAAAALPAADVEETRLKYEAIKDRYEVKTRWTRDDLSKRAEQVNVLPLYRMLYSTLSGLIHGDIRAIRFYGTGMNVEMSPSMTWVPESLAIGHHAVLTSLDDYLKVSDVDAHDEFEAVRKVYHDAWA
jgi:hypothetical protein